MQTIVDDQGRLHLPQELATKLGLKPGDRVVVLTGDGQCILLPFNTALHWQDNVLVHQGVGCSPGIADLRDEHVRQLSEVLSEKKETPWR